MEQESTLPSLIKKCSADIGVALNAEQIQIFVAYLKHLQNWNRSFNLTRITSDEDIVIKHFLDSFAALNAVEMSTTSSLLDIGTGAGFPGIPLKIVRPDLRLTLVEPVQKKTSFLRFIVGLLGLENTEIFDEPLERFILHHQTIGSYDYITTRALKPNLIMQIGAQLLRQGGVAIFYSSHPISGSDLPLPWHLMSNYSFDLPRGFGKRHISICSPSSYG